MKCPLCGIEFNEKAARSKCEACLIVLKCTMVKCPNCGYETPAEPSSSKKLIDRSKDKK